MHLFLLLIKNRLRALLYSLTAIGKSKKKKTGPVQKALAAAGVALLLSYLAVAMEGILVLTFYTLADALHGTPLAWLYFALAGMIVLVFMVVSSIYTAKSELFDAKDNELLLSMPIPQNVILASRLSLLLLINLALSVLVALPAGICYVIVAGASPLGVIYFILLFLALPFLGTALSALLALGLTLLLARIPKRLHSLITVIFSLAFLALYFVGYYALLSNTGELLGNLFGALSALDGIYPLMWFGRAIADGHTLYLLLSLAMLLLPSLAVFGGVALSFRRACTNGEGKAERRAYVARPMKASSPFLALLRREWQMMVAYPMYLLNSCLGAIFMLLAGGYLLFSSGDVTSLISGLNLGFPVISDLVVPTFALVICFFVSTSTLSSVLISVEGGTLWQLKCLPVAARTILNAKLSLYFLAYGIPSLFVSVVTAVVLRASFLEALLLIVLPLLFLLATGLFGMLVNLRMPYLKWRNMTQAVKQSGATLVTMLSCMAFLVLPVLAIVLLPEAFYAWVPLCFLLLLVAVCLVLLYLYKTRAEGMFEHLSA